MVMQLNKVVIRSDVKMKTKKYFYGYCILTALLMFSNCKNEQKNNALSSDGVEIHYNIAGKGKPTIVLVHGLSNTKEIWDSQIEYFRSDWTMESFGNDVVAVIDKQNLSQVILVGFSMGGAVILETAKKIPSRIEGLVLVDVFGNIEYNFSQEDTDKKVKLAREIFGDKQKIREYFPANMDTAIVNRYISMTYSASKIGWWESFTAFRRWWGEDYEGMLNTLKLPLMSINSDNTTTDVEAYQKYIPSYKLKTISTIGHFIMWEAPEEFNRLLEECIQEFIND
jgi:pimeloyl-ACP methyl ester carboxylesterase